MTAVTVIATVAVFEVVVPPAIWQLQSNLTAYVALGEALETPLVTLDGRIATAPGHAAVIDLVR